MNEKVTIRNIDEVYVQIEASNGVLAELRERFTFMVPGYQYMPAYRNRLWDGKLRLFDTRTRRIYRGLVPYVADYCIESKYDWDYENEDYDTEFSLIEAKEFVDSLNVKYEPRDYQMEAFVHTIRNKRTLLLSPTASGKSLIIYLIVRYLLQTHQKGLIIVPTVSLVEQMTKDFADYGWDVEPHIHKIYSGKEKETDRPIVISTWQSIYQLPSDFFKDFDFVIGDEAHQFKAKSMTDIMTKLINADYRIGTTGTLDGTKTHKLVLEGLFGRVHKVISTKELMDSNHLADFTIKCLLLKHPDIAAQAMKKSSYQDEIKFLIMNETRNRFIRNLALSLNGNTLILYQYVDKHGKILQDMIESKITGNRKCFFVYGKTHVDIREEIRRIVETETNAIIIASYGTFSTGINIRNLHNIIFASPSKSRIRNLQSIGRGLRLGENKTKATLFDIADDLRYKSRTNFTYNHFVERIKIYTEEKLPYKVYKIQI
jgi:superfamily II DNA or RNA helicase